jgi:hypothetical protein
MRAAECVLLTPGGPLVELMDGLGVIIDLGERQLRAQLVALPTVSRGGRSPPSRETPRPASAEWHSALVAARTLSALIYGVAPGDQISLITASAALCLATIAGALIPALRVMAIDLRLPSAQIDCPHDCTCDAPKPSVQSLGGPTRSIGEVES